MSDRPKTALVTGATDGMGKARYFDGMTESRANDQAYEASARRRLWQLSETLVGMERNE